MPGMKAHLTVARAWVEAHFAHYRVPSVPELFRVFRLYRSGQRFYHTIDHVAACLEFADKTFRARLCGPEGRHNKAAWANLQLALIYHDAIYDVHSKTNEEDSRDAWLEYADGKWDFHDEIIVQVGKLIILTKSHTLPEEKRNDTLAQMMIDTDMHVLALRWSAFPNKARPNPWRYYFDYAHAVWMEYREFGRGPYAAGRMQFLQSLKPEEVFTTPEMRGKTNIVAENIRNEIKMLTDNPMSIMWTPEEPVEK